jgi:hypothetical protein
MWTRRKFVETLGAAGSLAALADLTSCQSNPGTPRAGTKPASKNTLDRHAIVQRHIPTLHEINPQAVWSVGNGNFAFNVDATGLQSLNDAYAAIPLCTMAHWGWHSLPVPSGLDPAAFRYKMFNTYGRQVPYPTDSSGQTALFNYLRENPHKFHLGRIALVTNGQPLAASRIGNIDQQVDIYRGIITSNFTLDGVPVKVTTACHPDQDTVATRVECAKAKDLNLGILLAFPYGSSGISGADWKSDGKHTTTVLTQDPGILRLARVMDDARYWVRLRFDARAADVQQAAPHQTLLRIAQPTIELGVAFDKAEQLGPVPSVAETLAASEKHWADFWNSGGAIDLGDCTDTRAPELERRIVMSQYLTAIHCAGMYPSAETGLLVNSWYGKFHLEMHFWHSVHFTQWNRFDKFERSLGLYEHILPSAQAWAQKQGYAGARWPKMTDPSGRDSPSPVGPLLIWQQPHPIYYAWLCYKNKPTRETLARWSPIVRNTADFMASFAHFDPARAGGAGEFVLGPPMKTVSENANTENTINPTWELTAWRFGLMTAIEWMRLADERPNPKWGEVLTRLAKATIQDGAYLMQENMPETYTTMNWEHPALCGARGVLRGDGIDPDVMRTTVQKVHDKWQWNRTWGWDFPTMAMCAARNGLPDLAIDMLTLDAPMNRYLINGGNFQRDNVPAYYPGNGALLLATGMMAGGWDRGGAPLAGFPKGNGWNVKAENFPKWV